MELIVSIGLGQQTRILV